MRCESGGGEVRSVIFEFVRTEQGADLGFFRLVFLNEVRTNHDKWKQLALTG